MNLRPLLQNSDAKVRFVVTDSLGGLDSWGRGTELGPALTPNLDHRERAGVTGLTYPVAPGITPGSKSGRLALFGGDPSGGST